MTILFVVVCPGKDEKDKIYLSGTGVFTSDYKFFEFIICLDYLVWSIGEN